MLSITTRTLTTLALICALYALVAVTAAHASDAPSDRQLAQSLQAGGLVIVFRHGATFPDQADTDPLNFDDIGAQRLLNDKGKALAKALGEAFRQIGVPIGEIYTSKYNRAGP